MTTADHDARRRFASEMDRNFSVIAAAGSGKTRSITDRIVEIATSQHALEWLPQLVVVTYTNRAADEMQQRTRQQILEAGLSLDVIEAFNRAFFGTIHSFCVKLLAAHGHHLGLPATLELITDDDDLWNQFVQQYTTIGCSLSEENRRVLLRHVRVRHLMELARNADVDLAGAQPATPCPDTTFAKVYAARPKGATNISKAQAELKRWEKRWRDTDELAPWPRCATSTRDFVPLWREAFRPLREWVNACALCAASEVQRDYRDFRLERGLVTYRDQIALAAELMRLPDVARRIREKNYRVILDEAQDTDPQQFFVLLEITRPPEAAGIWAEDHKSPPRPGQFSMVGDFQQSIYRDPADLARYRVLHESLVETGAAEEVKFSVTFRLDQTQLEFVNQTFGEILNNQDGQVAFVELNPRPDVLPGQVIRFDFGCDVDFEANEAQRAALEARELAAWVGATGLKKLRAESWRNVAILCPRKAWLRPLRDALLDVDLPVEVQSESDRESESPAYAWLTALLAIMIDPNASYEIVGVLREIFGLSDDDLARFSQGDGPRFQIAEKISGRGTVPDTLNRLVRIREAITLQPLFSAVQEMVRTTQLRERLRSLPAAEFGGLCSELDNLLSTAAAEEARGLSLSDFAQNLRTKFHAVRETHPSSGDAIQLITAHKAKGSEWQAVIVPFLTRKVGAHSPRYPYVISGVETNGPQILFDQTDFEEFKESVKQTDRQEMERLLYVALTRAKHTLVLAFDRDFFLTAKGQFHSDTQIKWLRADANECNGNVVAALSSEARECVETSTRQEAVPVEQVYNNLERRETGWIDNARQCAARFIHTVSPSKFAPEEEGPPVESTDVWIEVEPELRPPRIENPATRYGVWWHDFVQQIPWSADASSWDEIFAAAHGNSPDMARSAREWKLLREKISNLSDFASHFANGGTSIVHTEMPFFWRMDGPSSPRRVFDRTGERCLEGIVDFALFEPEKKKWLILDWKTNRITPDKIDILRAQYRPQIAAYWKAVTEMTPNASGVEVGIYFTSTGQFVVYDADELAGEWERLRNLPQSDVAAEIVAN
ncbi:MAG: UvrD-helicase domain-containing protein [Verrucomicrobiota bacterium]